MSKRIAKKVLAAIAAVTVLAGAAVAAALLQGRSGADPASLGPDGEAVSERNAEESLAGATLEERFAFLARQRSNQCGLQASAIDEVAMRGRLQGSCCGPMSLHRYREQVAGLKRYASIPEIPLDPYDISVALAKRLIRFQQTIHLAPSEQATYDAAVRQSDEGGPCCCRCWRWTAFEGQAKYLITRRRFTSKQIAEVWSLEDGCGGEDHAH